VPNSRSVVFICIAVFAIAVSASACGGSDNSSSSASSTSADSTQEPAGESGVDVGTGKPIPLSPEEVKIAFISPGQQTPTGTSMQEGVEKVASKYGASVETYDGRLDPATQFALFQNVISSGKYNAIIALAISGEQSCEILSKTAPSKGIVVVTTELPLCGREFESAIGDGLWQPGTLDMVGTTPTVEGIGGWAKACEEETGETGNGETISINGYAGSPNYKVQHEALENTNMNLVADYATQYSTTEALEKTAAALTAHPNLKVVVTQFHEMVPGVLQAIKSAGLKPGVDVKVCDYDGGTEAELNLVKSGELTLDGYQNNEWVAIAATQSLFDAITGKPVERVILPGKNGEIESSSAFYKAGKIWPTIVTKQNVNEFIDIPAAG